MDSSQRLTESSSQYENLTYRWIKKTKKHWDGTAASDKWHYTGHHPRQQFFIYHVLSLITENRKSTEVFLRLSHDDHSLTTHIHAN